jgi:hypothetical protein
MLYTETHKHTLRQNVEFYNAEIRCPVGFKRFNIHKYACKNADRNSIIVLNLHKNEGKKTFL